MIQIERFRPAHLPRLRDLINAHLSALVPGWALSANFIASSLSGNPSQYILDPWVAERQTLCAMERGRLVGAAHLLRYAGGSEVGKDYRAAADVAWVLAFPECREALRTLLAAAQEQMAEWRATHWYAWDFGLPVPVQNGVAEVWPHLIAALEDSGYRPARQEALYGGRLDGVPEPGAAPTPELGLRRTVGRDGPRFAALLEGRELGYCECAADLTLGGERSALQGWGQLVEIQVAEGWRGRGIGTWLVQHAVAWLRLARVDRIVLAVGAEEEAAGAERFYRRLGWEVFSRERWAWRHH